MKCPHCGGETGGAQICPYCDSRLDGGQPESTGQSMPVGVYMGKKKSFLRVTEEYVHIHRQDAVACDLQIPYDQLTAVYYYAPKDWSGCLILRWTGNWDVPIPSQILAGRDPMAVPFSSGDKDTFYNVYCALFTRIQEERRKQYHH